MISYQVERYVQVIDEIRPLLYQHHSEVSAFPDVPLDPMWAFYERGAAAGMVIFTARDHGRLVGYAVYFTRNHHQFATVKVSASDFFWIDPSYRGNGVGRKLFRFMEEMLRDLGADIMHTAINPHHPAAQRLLESLGHEMIEMGFSKRLG